MNAQTKIVASDGWVKHDGSGCPLPYTTLVNVRLTGGMEDKKATFAGFWSSHQRDRWRPCHDWQIEAYRIVSPINLPARTDALARRRAS